MGLGERAPAWLWAWLTRLKASSIDAANVAGLLPDEPVTARFGGCLVSLLLWRCAQGDLGAERQDPIGTLIAPPPIEA